MKYMKFKCLPILTLCLNILTLNIIIPLKGFAENLYVSDGSGSDANIGKTESSAFKTIQKAVSVSKPGDIILVKNGTYRNDADYVVAYINTSGTSDAWITIRAFPGDKPKIKFNGWGAFRFSNGASYWEVSGFEIEGNNSAVDYQYALSQKDVANPLTNGNGISIDGRYDVGGKPHHIRIINNIIHDAGGGGVT